MPRYIIEKIVEPEQLGSAYAELLERLPGEEEDIAPNLDVIQKLRDMTEEEAAMVEVRPHILRVHPDIEVRTPPEPEAGAEARSATMEQVRIYHGFDAAHSKGFRGQGRRVFVLDDGLSEAWARKAGDRLVHKSSQVSGEDWRATRGDHGVWTFVWILFGAPEAEMGCIKVLSNMNGSGPISGIIRAISEAVGRGATEISMSLGGDGSSDDPLARAVNAARERGVLMPCAAGNDQRGKTAYTADSNTPGAAKGAMTVGAGDIDGNLADFSSWGDSVDIRYVGVNSQSGANDGSLTSYKSGTSMSTPVAAAACAVVGSGKGREAATQIEKAIYSTCGDTSLPPHKEGYGIGDVEFAAGKMGSAPIETPPRTAYRVVAGSFYIRENALKREKEVEKAGFPAFVEKRTG